MWFSNLRIYVHSACANRQCNVVPILSKINSCTTVYMSTICKVWAVCPYDPTCNILMWWILLHSPVAFNFWFVCWKWGKLLAPGNEARYYVLLVQPCAKIFGEQVMHSMVHVSVRIVYAHPWQKWSGTTELLIQECHCDVQFLHKTRYSVLIVWNKNWSALLW